MNILTSNRLTDLSERIRQAHGRAMSALIESVQYGLECGRLLIEAKAECAHGEWLPFLERSGVQERQAQRFMRVARSGMKSDTVSDLGGVTAALEHLASSREPAPDSGPEPDPRAVEIGFHWQHLLVNLG